MNKVDPIYNITLTNLTSNDYITFSLVEDYKSPYYSAFTISAVDNAIRPGEYKYIIYENDNNIVDLGRFVYKPYVEPTVKGYNKTNVVKGYNKN